ncbi:MAG: hypothetical protein KJ025_05725 [Burkholderiales bacterium]|nr:hypothetical protein [Burkholderiales bacterium]
MPHARNATKKLLTAAERALARSGARDALRTLDERQLRAKIARTRRQRDKYCDLFRRQRVAARARTGTKAGARGDANRRTREKAALFAHLLARFERRLEEVWVAARRAARKSTRKAARTEPRVRKPLAKGPRSKKPPVRARAPRSAGRAAVAGFVSPRAKGVDSQRQRYKSRGVAIHAHARSRGRRNQARRDRRG